MQADPLPQGHGQNLNREAWSHQQGCFRSVGVDVGQLHVGIGLVLGPNRHRGVLQTHQAQGRVACQSKRVDVESPVLQGFAFGEAQGLGVGGMKRLQPGPLKTGHACEVGHTAGRLEILDEGRPAVVSAAIVRQGTRRRRMAANKDTGHGPEKLNPDQLLHDGKVGCQGINQRRQHIVAVHGKPPRWIG